MKYVGSKNRLSKDITPIIQNCIDNNNIVEYIEPFVGGCAIFDKIDCKHRIGNDLDNIPISLFTHALTNGIDDFDTLPELPSKELYYACRDNPGDYADWYRAAILLFGSYNAKVYGGGYGAFANTKTGIVRNYFQEAKRNFLRQIKMNDYRNVEIPDKAMVYCDPPYANTIKYKENFDHTTYWEWVRQNSKYSYIICSEYNAPSDFVEIWSKELTNTIDNASRTFSTEKLFTYCDGLFEKYNNTNKTITSNANKINNKKLF